MRRILAFFIAAAFLVSCVSVKKYNSRLNDLRSPEDLKSDVSFAYRKIQKLHPDLYWYISKKELDFKFDSLKSTITSPMTSNDFFLKLSPVIASVREGHMRVIPLTKKLTRKEKQAQSKNGNNPFSRFDFEMFNDSLYIVKNYSGDTSIKAGTQIVSVNNIRPRELISKYNNTYSSDGFNKSFLEWKSGKAFPQFFYYQNDITDSALCELSYNKSMRTIWLKRDPAVRPSKEEKHVKKSAQETKNEEEKNKLEKKKRKICGYDGITRIYSKDLSFPIPGSSVALMTIKDFSAGRFRKFYSDSFRRLDSLKTKTLIIDLRDNLGGRLRDIICLYSYLVDSSFVFTERSEVVSRTSLLNTNYFRMNPLAVVIGLPAELVYTAAVLLKVRKGENDRFYYSFHGVSRGNPKPDHFTGNVYVLINGGSYSASCILASNLKGSGRAIFAGEETGGACNGTVAGILPLLKLPESKLSIRLGLARITPYYQAPLDGRGILPDIPVKPALNDIVKGKDTELNRVLEEVKGR